MGSFNRDLLQTTNSALVGMEQQFYAREKNVKRNLQGFVDRTEIITLIYEYSVTCTFPLVRDLIFSPEKLLDIANVNRDKGHFNLKRFGFFDIGECDCQPFSRQDTSLTEILLQSIEMLLQKAIRRMLLQELVKKVLVQNPDKSKPLIISSVGAGQCFF